MGQRGRSANLAAYTTTLIIHGVGFSSTASNNTVTFSSSVTEKVTKATSEQRQLCLDHRRWIELRMKYCVKCYPL